MQLLVLVLVLVLLLLLVVRVGSKRPLGHWLLLLLLLRGHVVLQVLHRAHRGATRVRVMTNLRPVIASVIVQKTNRCHVIR
jgi:hypothetical protein